MAETEVGPLKASVLMDLTKGWNSGVGKIKSDTKELTTRKKELGNVVESVGGSLKTTAKAGVALGVGLLGAVTGILAFSPQLRTMWMQLKPRFLELGLHVGEKLKPVLDEIVGLTTSVIQSFIRWDQESGFLAGLGMDVRAGLQALREYNEEKQILQTVLDLVSGIGGALTAFGGKAFNFSVSMIGLDNTMVIGMAAALTLSGHPMLAAGLLGIYGLERLTRTETKTYDIGGQSVSTPYASEQTLLRWGSIYEDAQQRIGKGDISGYPMLAGSIAAVPGVAFTGAAQGIYEHLGGKRDGPRTIHANNITVISDTTSNFGGTL